MEVLRMSKRNSYLRNVGKKKILTSGKVVARAEGDRYIPTSEKTFFPQVAYKILHAKGLEKRFSRS